MNLIRITSLRNLLIAAILFFPVFCPSAIADDLGDAQELIRQGKNTEALEILNRYLIKHPKDAQAQFQKGIILTEQNNTSEAIRVFSDLTRDYPNLPEPYNNLAVLYFSLGQFEKAKAALEAAIRTHPSYATAHENLGDIYAKMASQAYDRALQLDKSNTTAQTKLALVKELFTPGTKELRTQQVKSSPSKPPANAVALNTPRQPATPIPNDIRPTTSLGIPLKEGEISRVGQSTPIVPTIAAPPVKTVSSPKQAPPAPSVPSKITAVTPTPTPTPATGSQSAPKPAAKHVDKQQDSAQSAEVLKTLNGWAKAWSDRNAHTYLSFYGKDFKTPKGEKRSNWENSRKERLANPKLIQVAIIAPDIKFSDATHATASFKQIYRSDTLKTSTRKTLVLAKSGEKWVILEEKVGH